MSRHNVELVRRLHDAFERRDNETPFSIYDPDIEWDMSRSAFPLPGEDELYYGHAGVRRYWKGWLAAWEFIDAPIERLVDAGDQVVTLFGETTARGKTSGIELQTGPWAQVWTLCDGKVVRVQVFGSQAAALDAVGLNAERP